MRKLFLAVMFAALGLFVSSQAVGAVASFANGFELNTDGWFTDGSTIQRVSSGTGGITSADGSYHALVNAGAFTRWGGYESTFPANGYTTSVDIYLDMALADGTDKRFDYSSAISSPAGAHRRDFIFHAGTVPGTSATNQWAISVSNNAPGWPLNPGRTPILVSQSGWYTFEHTFMNNGSGVLAVELKVKDAADTELGSWVLSDPSDIIGTTVGGNRYGWFVNSAFGTLAIDNSEKLDVVPVVGPPSSKSECKADGWMTFNNPTFKNQGDCVSFVQSNGNAVGNKLK